MIQDKLNTRFGKWIHDVLAYYINVVDFKHIKGSDCSFKLILFQLVAKATFLIFFLL